MEEKICCICGKKFVGYGNNPEPITSEGCCCDQCNKTRVIPARLQAILCASVSSTMLLNI